MRIEKPWGYEDLIHVGESYMFKKLFMKSGEACSLQYHARKHETVLVHSGELLVSVGASVEQMEDVVLVPGDFVVLEPGVIHRMSAIEDCIYFEASTPELEDVVRLEDLYGRDSASSS